MHTQLSSSKIDPLCNKALGSLCANINGYREIRDTFAYKSTGRLRPFCFIETFRNYSNTKTFIQNKCRKFWVGILTAKNKIQIIILKLVIMYQLTCLDTEYFKIKQTNWTAGTSLFIDLIAKTNTELNTNYICCKAIMKATTTPNIIIMESGQPNFAVNFIRNTSTLQRNFWNSFQLYISHEEHNALKLHITVSF